MQVVEQQQNELLMIDEIFTDEREAEYAKSLVRLEVRDAVKQ